MRFARSTLLVTSAIAMLAAPALAQAPLTQMYQGRLTDASLEPITTATDITFRIWDAPDESGSELWSELQTVSPDELGVFTVVLGATTPFPPDLFDGSVRFLSMTITGDDEMLPRQPMASVPYSMAANAPGFANSYSSTLAVTDMVKAVDTLEVVVPGPGYLILECDGLIYQYRSTSVNCWVYVCIDTAAGISDYRACTVQYEPSTAGPGYTYTPFAVTRVVQVEQAGTYAFYLNGWRPGSSATAYLYYANLKAVYYPTHIGTESPIADPDDAAAVSPKLVPHELQEPR